jgi:hypothetical protein
MSAFNDWAKVQWAGAVEGAKGIGTNIVSDVGSTYQAFLMGGAGWRVPPGHDGATHEIAEQVAMAETEQAIEAQQPEPGVDLSYC